MTSSPHGHYVTCRYPADAGENGRAYQAFVPAPIADLELSLPSTLVCALEEATAAVRDLCALSAPARLLHWREALTSSRIEHIAATPRQALASELAIERPVSAAAADIAGNFRANMAAVELGASLATPRTGEPQDDDGAVTLADLANLHRTLLRYGHSERIAGRYRTRAVWIGGMTPLNAAYVAPPAQEVGPLMVDLCAFMARRDLPILVQAAIAHSQFEAIHPFGDGNGRSGRALIHLLLRRRGLTTGALIAPISGVWVSSTDSYYGGLSDARGENERGLEMWLDFFADTVREAAVRAVEIAGEVAALQASWRERLVPYPRAIASALRLLDLLPAYPFLNTRTVMRELAISDVAAGYALRALTFCGILHVSPGKRNRTWACPQLLHLLGETD